MNEDEQGGFSGRGKSDNAQDDLRLAVLASRVHFLRKYADFDKSIEKALQCNHKVRPEPTKRFMS